MINDDPEREKRDEERLNILEEIFEHREQEQRRLLTTQSLDNDFTEVPSLETKSDEEISSKVLLLSKWS